MRVGTLENRRSFFGKAAAAAGATVTGSSSASAKSKTTPTVELMKIGVMAVGEYSHLSTIWSPAINPVMPERWPGRTSRMLITHCWDSRPEKAKEYASQYKCEAVEHYYDMVDKVDALITGGYYECKWWPQLTKPYLEAGIPCFINRPFAMSMKAAHEMVDRAKKYNTPIMSSDAHEDLKEGIVAKQKVRNFLKEGKHILGASATTDAREYAAHTVHGLYMLLPIFGLDVAQASLQAPGWFNTSIPSSPKPMDWGIMSLQYNGINIENYGAQDKPFIATVHPLQGNCGSRGTLRVYYTGGWQDFDQYRIDARDDLINQRYHLQSKTVFDMQQFFESREMPWSFDYILEKTRIYLAAFYSHMERDGRMVKLDDLPEDWVAPSPYPDWIDESIFK